MRGVVARLRRARAGRWDHAEAAERRVSRRHPASYADPRGQQPPVVDARVAVTCHIAAQQQFIPRPASGRLGVPLVSRIDRRACASALRRGTIDLDDQFAEGDGRPRQGVYAHRQISREHDKQGPGGRAMRD